MMSEPDLEAHIIDKMRRAVQSADFDEVVKAIAIDECNTLLEVYHSG
jgi:hypothetical protein